MEAIAVQFVETAAKSVVDVGTVVIEEAITEAGTEFLARLKGIFS